MDVLQSLSIGVPNTWTELINAVERIEASGINMRGICLDLPLPGLNAESECCPVLHIMNSKRALSS